MYFCSSKSAKAIKHNYGIKIMLLLENNGKTITEYQLNYLIF